MGPLWHGSVVASGFVFDDAHLSRDALLERLIALWCDGARLARSGGRTVLVGLAARRVDSRLAPGAPLVSCEGRWLLGPVDDATLAAAPRDAVIEPFHGALRVTRFSELEPLDPSELLELAPPHLQTRVELLAPPPEPTPVQRAQPEPPTSAELFRPMFERLGQVAAVRPPRASWWRRLMGRLRGRPRELPATGTPRADDRPSREGTPGRLRGWFARLGDRSGSTPSPVLDRLRRWLSPRPAPALPDPGGLPAAPPPRSSPIANGLAALFLRLTAPLLSGAQARQRRYLDDLRRRFAGGDLLEALHRAIPIGGEASGTPALGVPGRRDTLALLAVSTPGPTMTLANDALDDLKGVYRRAFDQLVAEGKVEEAAYVQAQLLRDVAAATAFLEQQGRVELAAQLGAAHGLAPVQLVRLWMLAKRPHDALLVARRANAFAAAVAFLAQRDAALANELRGHWAAFLAERGRFAEALDASAPLPSPPPDFDAWLERADEAGGASAATALAVTVARKGPPVAEARLRLERLLAHETSPALAMAAGHALLRHAPRTAEALHRDLWRHLVAAAGDGQPVDRALVDRVMAAANDEVLRADAVPLPSVPRAAAAPFEMPAEDRGRLPILDVAELPRGRLAVALGAAGLAILGRDGATLTHLAVKADALVAGAPGVPALVVSRDGSLTRVLRLEPHTFALQPWFQGELSCFAPAHDGYCWAVGMDDAVVTLDVQASGPMEWWRLSGFRAASVEAAGAHVWMRGVELATGQPTGRMWSMGAQQQTAVLAAGQWCWSGADDTRLWTCERLDDLRLRLGTSETGTLTLPPGWWDVSNAQAGLVATCRDPDGGTAVYAFAWADFRPACLARLPGTSQVRLRVSHGGTLFIVDELGRVVELELPSGTLRRVHRV